MRILFQLTNGLGTDSFDYNLHWVSLWVEISTIAYKMNSIVVDQKGQWRTVPI